MTRERFSEIMKEYGYGDLQIQLLWNDQPSNLTEEELRKAATACQGKGPKLVVRDGRMYYEIAPGVLEHRRDLEDSHDTSI